MVIDENLIFLDQPFQTKSEVLAFVSENAVEQGIATDAKVLENFFNEREKEYSTAVQDGVAIPHVKNDVVKEAKLYFIKLKTPIDWGSPDDFKVQMIFPILVPGSESGTTHIQLLSSIAVNLLEDDFKADLLSATTPDEVYKILENVKVE